MKSVDEEYGRRLDRQIEFRVMITQVASPPTAASLKNVALTAGVSAMTVSRALRGARGLTEATRQRVLQVAAKLGYHPDPHVARLMHRVRRYRKRRIAAVIAVVRDEIPDDDLRDPAYHFVPVDYIRRRAEQHGYQVQEILSRAERDDGGAAGQDSAGPRY